jgi:dienelactone hydrolase
MPKLLKLFAFGVLAVVASLAAAPAAEVVHFKSADGINLEAELTRPALEGPCPAVVLAHGFRYTRRSYDPLVPKLTQAGIAALAVDLRGRGGSTGEVGRKELLTAAQQKNIWQDIAAGVDFLKQRKDIDGNRIAIAGASFSGIPALRAATERPFVRAVVVLAAARVPDEIAAYYREHKDVAVLFLAAADDPLHPPIQEALDSLGPEGEARKVKIFESGGHATQMFGQGIGAEEEIVDFLRAHLQQ